MSLQVIPQISLFDSEVSISAAGLDREQCYLFVLSVTHATGTHESRAVFRSLSDGTINLARECPLRGDYCGVDAMGLFTSMHPLPNFKIGSPIHATPPALWMYTLALFDSGGKLIDRTTLQRVYQHPDVLREEVENEAISGTVFRPKDEGRYPSVIDMYGSAGGIKEHRASLLASHGFAVLSLPYFSFKRLPSSLNDVDVDYFKKAIEWFVEQRFTGDRVGLIGTSLGGTLAMMCAQRFSQVKAVCAINSAHLLHHFTRIKEHGKRLPFSEIVNGDDCWPEFVGEVLYYDLFMDRLPYSEDVAIKVEQAASDTKFLIAASTDDISTCSIKSARVHEDRLKRSGHDVRVEVLHGGHLIEPPYMPHLPVVFSKYIGAYLGLGGETVSHCVSQRAFWKKLLAFFEEVLGPPMRMSVLNSPLEKCHI